jgi:hypothetical protein
MSADRVLPAGATPAITAMRVIPIARHESMLLNLRGAPGTFFMRNLVILKAIVESAKSRGGNTRYAVGSPNAFDGRFDR